MMKRDPENVRRIGAITGLVIGLAIMYAMDRVGLVPAFFLGAGGCVAGSMIARRWVSSKNQTSDDAGGDA
jgi:uncharacterized membrane protein YeaQ/YmgE (transglycosylase-associated protein family)